MSPRRTRAAAAASEDKTPVLNVSQTTKSIRGMKKNTKKDVDEADNDSTPVVNGTGVKSDGGVKKVSAGRKRGAAAAASKDEEDKKPVVNGTDAKNDEDEKKPVINGTDTKDGNDVNGVGDKKMVILPPNVTVIWQLKVLCFFCGCVLIAIIFYRFGIGTKRADRQDNLKGTAMAPHLFDKLPLESYSLLHPPRHYWKPSK